MSAEVSEDNTVSVSNPWPHTSKMNFFKAFMVK